MKKAYIILSTAFLLLSSFGALAQMAPPASTPIDGGLSVLLAGGVAYGVKKIVKHRKDI